MHVYIAVRNRTSSVRSNRTSSSVDWDKDNASSYDSDSEDRENSSDIDNEDETEQEDDDIEEQVDLISFIQVSNTELYRYRKEVKNIRAKRRSASSERKGNSTLKYELNRY